MKNLTKPVCELENFHINKLFVEGMPQAKGDKMSAAFRFDYDLACRTDNPHVIKMAMSFSIMPNPKDPESHCPYSIHSEIEGIFSFPEDIDKGEMGYLCRVNSLTILYGILRGEIANVTGSFKNGKFILPTVMMQDIVKDIEARKAKEREAGQVAEKSSGKDQ